MTSKVEEKAKKAISEGFEWIEMYCQAAMGRIALESHSESTHSASETIVENVRTASRTLEKEISSLNAVLKQCEEVEYEMFAKESQQEIAKSVVRRLQEDLKEVTIFEERDAIAKSILRRYLGDMIHREIRNGKRNHSPFSRLTGR